MLGLYPITLIPLLSILSHTLTGHLTRLTGLSARSPRILYEISIEIVPLLVGLRVHLLLQGFLVVITLSSRYLLLTRNLALLVEKLMVISVVLGKLLIIVILLLSPVILLLTIRNLYPGTPLPTAAAPQILHGRPSLGPEQRVRRLIVD